MAGLLLEVVSLVTSLATKSGKLNAVDEVSFKIDRGQSFGIVGESGSGKSVLSRTIIGVHAENRIVSTKGEIIFEGRNLLSLPEKEMRKIRGREIAMVFQDPMSSLNPVKKIGEQIVEVLIKKLGLSRTDSRYRAIELMNSMGIAESEKQLSNYPMNLSGGMRQRIAIAIAMAPEPKLLIADEPTTALDVTIQGQILNLLQEQTNKFNTAIILISHNLGVISRYTDRVAVMYSGQFVEESETTELMKNPMMPYTSALMRSVPDLTSPPHTKLRAIDGMPPSLLEIPQGCRFQERCQSVRDKCFSEMPEIILNGGDHRYRCWYPLEN